MENPTEFLKNSSNDGEENKSEMCHINRNTLPLKIALFLYYGAMSAILPYLTIHMKDIGISLMETAIIYALLPFTAFLGPLLMGFLADKLGHYKVVLVVATVINGIFHILLLTVPKYSESVGYATTAVIEFNRRGPTSSAFLRPLHTLQCQQLINSVQQPRHPNNETDLQESDVVITLHSCRWGQDWSHANPVSSEVIRRWNIPHICQRQKNVQTSNGYSILELMCKLNETNRNYRTGNRYRPVDFSDSNFDPACAIKLNLNGVAAQNVQQDITCRTNYTFATGTQVKNGSRSMTFWLYFLVRTVSNVFMAACYSLLDATTLAVVKANKEKGAQYGKERIFCVLGSALISPLAGLMVDTMSNSKGYTDYSPAFYLALAMLFLNVIGYIFMDLEVEKPASGMWKNATALLKYPEVIVFLIMIFIMGNMWGFVESYLFIFLDELNAPKYLLGLTLTVGSLASIPFLYGAQSIVAKVGRVNIIVLAFLVYFVRFFGYSYIPNPYWCFPFEAMEAFTHNLMWVAAATYCAVLSPRGLLGTLTGVIGSLYYGLGKGSGSFIGGYVINLSSSRLAFRYFGIFGGSTGVIYFLLSKLWLESAIRKRNERENNNKKDQDLQPNENDQMLQGEEAIQ